MRVLLVVDSLHGGSAELEVLALAATLLEAGHAVDVAYFNDGRLRPRYVSLGLALHRVSRAGLRDPFALVRLVRLMRWLRPDIVHTQLVKSDMLGTIAACLTGVPVRISTLHSCSAWRRRALPSLVSRFVTRGVLRIVTVSEAVRVHAHRFSRLSLDKMVVIPNTVDWRRFAETPEDIRIPPVVPVVGIIGRLVPVKGVDTFLHAATMIRARHPEMTFEIVGEGELRQALVEQSRSLGLAECVRFMGFSDDIVPVMQRLSVLAMPSRAEGLPRVLLEGMAAALPIVATPVDGTPEVLRHDVEGLLGASAEGIASLVNMLCDHPERCAALADGARRRIESELTAAEMVRKWVVTLRRVAGDNRRAAPTQRGVLPRDRYGNRVAGRGSDRTPSRR